MTRFEGWPAIFLIAFHVTHYLCVAVWVGAMFFNLIVGFPLMWKRSKASITTGNRWRPRECRRHPGSAFLVMATFVSGWLINSMTPPPKAFLLIKHGLFAGMFACHLMERSHLWPKIIFSADDEALGLFWRYKLSMIGSTTFGVVAITASYYWSIVG